MSLTNNSCDLLKLVFNLLIIGILIVLTFLVIQPFLFGFFWAVMVVITTWPLMKVIEKRLFLGRVTSLILMMLLLSLVLFIPLSLIFYNITKNSTFLIEWTKNFSHQTIPQLNWLNSVPLVGYELHQKWLDVANSNDGKAIIKHIQPYIGTIASWMITQLANFSVLIFHCGAMIIFSVLLFYKGERVTEYVALLAKRVAPDRGLYAIQLAGQAVRAVALGVVVTALVQSLIGGLSLALTGIAYSGILTLLIFIFCVAQIGSLPIMIPAIIWLFYQTEIISATILIIVAIILTTLDSVMRAILIKRGADLPFILILCGVIGGLLGFGAMGLFIGPVVLALSYKLINGWMNEKVINI